MERLDGVREYDRIRRFLSRIYLYGFFSREDFSKSGSVGSKKDYDYTAKLIRIIFPDSEENAIWREGKKYLRIQRSYVHRDERRLSDSYKLHTLDVNCELPEFLYILKEVKNEKKNITDLCKTIESRIDVRTTFRYSTVRRRVIELEEYGYIEKQNGYFRLSEDGIDSLTDTELQFLADFIGFVEGVTYPRVAGSFIRRTLHREFIRRNMNEKIISPLLLRHSAAVGVFDEDLVYQLIDCIHKKREVELTIIPEKRGKEQGEKLEVKRVIAWPVALRLDARLGRWYLLSIEEERSVLRRVRDIQSIKQRNIASPEDYQEDSQVAKKKFSKSAFSGAIPSNGSIFVQVQLCFAGAPELLAQFCREVRIGEIIERQEGLFYQVWINDPWELQPFLRMYALWIKIFPGEHQLDVRLRKDLEEMRRQIEEPSAYEVV